MGEEPIGPQFDLYATQDQLGPSVMPLGPVPAGAAEVEIRVVGRNDLSQGWEVHLDYLRWEPNIPGPGTAEGIWAQVVGTHGCDYRPQDLGPAYSGGHQFWVQPSSLGAWVDIAIQIPKTAAHDLAARYTKSCDYGSIQAFLDGQPLGRVADTFSPTVVPGEPLTLGNPDLSAGRHVLRFQAVRRNPESKGYLMGIDHVVVKEMRHRSHQLYIGTYMHLDSAPGHAVAAHFGQEFVKTNGPPDRVVLEGLRQEKDGKWVRDRVWWEYAGGRRIQYPDWAAIAGK